VEGLDAALVASLIQIKDGVLGAAGTELWQSLQRLVKRRQVSGGTLDLGDDVQGIGDATALAGTLAGAADADPALAEDLAEWISRTRSVSVSVRGNVDNHVSGDVSGTVIQIGNIEGERKPRTP
jgi:hypothetical protein